MIYFSIHLPSKDVPQAGQRICYANLTNILAENNVYCVSQYNSTEGKYINDTEFVCEDNIYVKINNCKRIINFLKNIRLPFQVAIRSDAKCLKIINELVHSSRAKEIFIEYEQGAYILPHLPENMTRTVVFHDIISQSLFRKIKRINRFSPRYHVLKHDLEKTRRWERQIARFIDTSIVFSEKDKNILLDLGFDAAKIIVSPPSVDVGFQSVQRTGFDPKTLLFWGSLNRFENEDAMLWFFQQIWPDVRKAIPDIRVIVLGADPSPKLMKFASRNVIIPGFVEDPVPYFEMAGLAIAPLRYGAGIKIKVLEFLAARIFTVCTPVAAEGISFDDTQAVVAYSAQEFSQAVIDNVRKLSRKNCDAS